jgi:hypothetical protein
MKAIYDDETWSISEIMRGNEIPDTCFPSSDAPTKKNKDHDWLLLNDVIWIPTEAPGLIVDPTDDEVSDAPPSPICIAGTYGMDDSKLTQNGLYLGMFHGRRATDEALDDWGSQGPILGPLQWCHSTYGNWRLNWIREADDHPDADLELTFIDNLLAFNGVYYGDWTLFTPQKP